jgi:hypothetical protein
MKYKIYLERIDLQNEEKLSLLAEYLNKGWAFYMEPKWHQQEGAYAQLQQKLVLTDQPFKKLELKLVQNRGGVNDFETTISNMLNEKWQLHGDYFRWADRYFQIMFRYIEDENLLQLNTQHDDLLY